MMKGTQKNEQAIKCIDALDFTKDWNTWRGTLQEAIITARGLGLSDEDIQAMAVRLGDFMAEKVCPATKEEELIKEMWTAATPEERKVLATVMFRMLT